MFNYLHAKMGIVALILIKIHNLKNLIIIYIVKLKLMRIQTRKSNKKMFP